MGVPKIRGTFLGVHIRTTIFCGLYWGPPKLENYQIKLLKQGNPVMCYQPTYCKI